MTTNAFSLEKLFEPARLGEMNLRNRMIMPPMGTNYATQDGYVTDQMTDYYEQRAKSGVGLVIVEAACVDFPRGKGFIRQLGIDDDRFTPGLRQLAQIIHRQGAKSGIQLHHGGNASKTSITGLQPVAPSPLARPGGDLPKELSVKEIEDIVFRFAKAAERAKKAGFDGVEVHAAHHYLLAQFLSSAWNKRQDGYGGDLRNKARITLETVQAIREKVGRNYPLWCRINGREFGIKDGITLEETQELAVLLEDAGVNALHISAFAYTSPRSVPPMSVRRATMVPLAEAVKKVVKIPVIAVGRIDPQTGEGVLQAGRADFVAMGRGLIADPELPNKAASGRLKEVVPCIACNHCMECVTEWDEPVHCAVNAAAGRESEFQITPAPQPKRVLIIGGGPAGMEAARVARLRGHKVELWEKEKELGGQMLAAAVPPHKGGIPILIEYLASQMEKLGVRVQLGRKATPALIKGKKSDVVILATGAEPLIPEISGVDRAKVVTAQQILAGMTEVGESVIVIGGEFVGCETADFLADKGKKVTILRRGSQMAEKLAPSARELLLKSSASQRRYHVH